jgi:FMN phosphatase YigB (HAD superfamily)
MPLTVLFDLDETLLSTNTDRFLPGYFELLSQSLSHLGSPKKVTREIRHAVGEMIANQDPGKTLNEVFAEHFYSALGTTEAASRQSLEAFYRDEFPKLSDVTQPKPAALELINWCRLQGFRIAIATNPLFPETATRQRIRWAGLEPDHFAFFTTYEYFHFAKPDLTYYAEVLGRLGWPEGPIVMVGDDPAYDLIPMDEMGYQTFWVNQEKTSHRWQTGALSDVKPWLKHINHKGGQMLSDQPEVNLALIRSTAAVFDTYLKFPHRKQFWGNGKGNVQAAFKTLAQAVSREREIYHPIWKRFSKDAKVDFAQLEDINLPENYSGQVQDLKTTLLAFIKARKASLQYLEALYPSAQTDSTVDLNHKNADELLKMVKTIAEQDRIMLRQWANLLDIHKNY